MADSNAYEFKPAAEAEGLYRRWISHLDEQFSKHQSAEQRAEIVRDELYQIFLGRPHGGKGNSTLTSELGSVVLSESLDATNVTLGVDIGPEFDINQYMPRRPLIYFWRMFDRSPLGINHWLGFRFRCMLGRHIFKTMGAGVKIYPDVRFFYGYNLSIEDNCVIRRNVLLDDRQPLTLSAGSIVNEGEHLGGE